MQTILTPPSLAGRLRAAFGTPRIALLCVLAVVTLVSLPLIAYGPQSGHSFVYNICWARGFDAALFEGRLYPRWLTELNGGAGSPVFFFYAPVPFYVHALAGLLSLSSDVSVQLGVTMWLILLASSVAFFTLARRLADPLAAAIGTLTYALLPYHLAVDGWVRQAIGELTAYVWLPLLLLQVERLAAERKGMPGIALCYALLCATHLPSTVLFSGFLVLFAAFRAWERRLLGVLIRTLLGMGTGALLAGLYLAPALLLQYAISADALWTTFFDYGRWFFGAASPDPVFSRRLLQLVGLSTLVFAGLFLIARRRAPAPQRRARGVWLALVAGAWFLMTPLSAPLWRAVSVLQKVQFPWRAAIILDVAVAALATLATAELGLRNRLALAAAGLCAVLLAVSLAATARSAALHWHKSRDPGIRAGIAADLARGIDAPEYIPHGIKLPYEKSRGEIWDRARSMPALELDEPGGKVTVLGWGSRRLAFDLELDRPTHGTVRQFQFPGWTIHANGTTEAALVERHPVTGFMRLALPKGRYRLELVLEHLFEERVGAATSALGLVGALLLAWWERRPRGNSGVLS